MFKITKNLNAIQKKNGSSKYRICYIETAEQIGGGQVGLFDILESLDYGKFDPWVITSSSQGEFYQKIKKLQHVHTLVVPFTSFLPKKIREEQDLPIYSPVGVYLLKNMFQKIKPHLVHSNHLPAGKYGAKAARICNIPNIVTMRCMYYRRKYYFNRFVEQRLCNNADRIVFNSTRGAELLKERTAANNITSILNGIKIERFLQNTDSTFYSKFNVPQGRKVFLLPSRIYPLKGHQILIEAISHLITDYPEIHVVFLGNEDRYFPGTKEFYNTLAVKLSVHDHITWIDFTNDVVPFIKNAYCVTLPSFSEGCPRVLIEALAASTPIIGSKIDGINEILDDGVNGHSFISKDSDSLAAAIRKLLSLTIEQYQVMKDNCLKNAEEKYDLKKMINQYQNLYLELLKGTDT